MSHTIRGVTVVSLLTLTSSKLLTNPGADKNVLLGQNDVRLRQLSAMNGDLNLKMRRYVLPPVLTKHVIIIQIF